MFRLIDAEEVRQLCFRLLRRMPWPSNTKSEYNQGFNAGYQYALEKVLSESMDIPRAWPWFTKKNGGKSK